MESKSNVIKILFVEGNELYANRIQNQLSLDANPSFSFIWTDQAHKGVEYLADGNFQVVLLDLRLPDSQGIDTFDRLHTYAPHLPFVILTDEANEAVAIEAVCKGAQDYLVKRQIHPGVLRRVLRYSFERKSFERKAQLLPNTYESILNSVPVPTLTTDQNGHIRFSNRAATQFFQMSSEELRLKKWYDFYTQTATKKELDHSTRSQDLSQSLEVKMIHGTGKQTPVRITSGRLPQTMDSGEHSVIVLTDISGDEKPARAISQLAEDLKRVENTKSHFIAMASHALKTPLTTIKGHLQLFVREVSAHLTARQCEQLEFMKKAVDKLQILCNDLLHLHRVESGQMRMQMEHVDVSELLEKLVSLYEAEARGKQLTISFRCSKPLNYIYCDRKQLMMVIDNLLSNAVKYNRKGGSICVVGKNIRRGVQIEVCDTGIGIRKEDIPKLFDAFQDIHKPGMEKVESTGFGLSLVKRIVDTHIGLILVKSSVGKGTTFTIKLPCEKRNRETSL
jgi:PAS domain S-box-containing protein